MIDTRTPAEADLGRIAIEEETAGPVMKVVGYLAFGLAVLVSAVLIIATFALT
jgi:hypothetical protein